MNQSPSSPGEHVPAAADLYPPIEPYDSGILPVSGGHALAYEQCGNSTHNLSATSSDCSTLCAQPTTSRGCEES